jgi:enediyne biosynthesis protein E4
LTTRATSRDFALNKDGREIASMGIAVGDYENNGLVDFFVTDFGDDYKVLYHNDGDASFTDVSYKAGVAQTTIPFVGWGDGFIDYDNDGWLDLFMVNGHVYPQVDQHDWGTTLPSGRCCSTTCRMRAARDGSSNMFRR